MFANANVLTAQALETSAFIENIRGISAIKMFCQEGNRQRQWQNRKDKLVLSGEWSIGPIRTLLGTTRFGRYTETATSQTSTVDDRTFSPKWVTDLDIAAKLSDTLTVAVGANNLFDVYPDCIGVTQANTGLGQYGNFAPFGLSGGFYYARVGVKF